MSIEFKTEGGEQIYRYECAWCEFSLDWTADFGNLMDLVRKHDKKHKPRTPYRLPIFHPAHTLLDFDNPGDALKQVDETAREYLIWDVAVVGSGSDCDCGGPLNLVRGIHARYDTRKCFGGYNAELRECGFCHAMIVIRSEGHYRHTEHTLEVSRPADTFDKVRRINVIVTKQELLSKLSKAQFDRDVAIAELTTAQEEIKKLREALEAVKRGVAESNYETGCPFCNGYAGFSVEDPVMDERGEFVGHDEGCPWPLVKVALGETYLTLF